MRTIILVLAAMLVGQGSRANNSETTNLKLVLSAMSELASEGASLEYFGYTEDFAPHSNGSCRQVTSGEAVEYLKDSIESLDVERSGAATADQIATALEEFAQILDGDSYLRCRATGGGNRSTSTVDEFIGRKYRIQFEWGYED